MDFFHEQDRARRRTGQMVVLFALAVLFLVGGVNLAVALILQSAEPAVFVLVTLAVLLVIALGSLHRIATLRGGGRVVAEMLGGRRLEPGRAQDRERVLLNVVEEMAIASGTPVPAVYLLEGEQGINAFAAGFDPSDAVVGVTRGAVDQLSRDELQGVVAHEFSHILNGDMRLNVRLMGVLHGILVLGLIGEGTLRALSGGRRRGRGAGGGVAAILAIGAALMVFGYAGTFFGNLIKAAASRQREFLADASAVQFTRNPHGIGGALLKIAGHAGGSRLAHPSARAASHFYFGAGVSDVMAGLASTHPPLEERLVRILPQMRERIGKAFRTRGMAPGALHGEVLGLAAAEAARQESRPAAAALEQVGNVTSVHIARARELLTAIPPELRAAAAEPFVARAIVYGLMLDPREPVRRAQMAALEASAPPDALRELGAFGPMLDALPVESRLPLVELALPALAGLDARKSAEFLRDLDALAQADGQVTLAEVALQRLVRRHLEPLHDRRAARRAAKERTGSLARSTPAAALVLSQLARACAPDEAAAARAFSGAWQELGLGTRALSPAESSRGTATGDALDELARLAPRERRSLLAAAATLIHADREVRPDEAELFRILAESLAVPIPPLLPDQRLA